MKSMINKLYLSEVPLDDEYWEKRSQNSLLYQNTENLAKEIKNGLDEKKEGAFRGILSEYVTADHKCGRSRL